MKPRAEVRKVSAKRLAKHPELARSSSTIVRSGTPIARRSKPRKTSATGGVSPLHPKGDRPARRSKPKASNPKRRAKNHARSYGEKRAWVVQQPCAVCGWSAGDCDPAHTSGDNGTGFKASSKHLAPLCPPRYANMHLKYFPGFPNLVEGCHRESHRIGVKSFEAKHNVSLVALAEKYEQLWQAYVGGAA